LLKIKLNFLLWLGPGKGARRNKDANGGRKWTYYGEKKLRRTEAIIKEPNRLKEANYMRAVEGLRPQAKPVRWVRGRSNAKDLSRGVPVLGAKEVWIVKVRRRNANEKPVGECGLILFCRVPLGVRPADE